MRGCVLLAPHPILRARSHTSERGFSVKTSTRRILYWTPRILTLLFAAFISIFALDVFGVGYSPWETAVALFMHLIPTFIILIALGLAWRWEWIGAVAFLGLALFYVVMTWGQFPWSVYLIIAGPAVLIGILFGYDWVFREELHAAGVAQRPSC